MNLAAKAKCINPGHDLLRYATKAFQEIQVSVWSDTMVQTDMNCRMRKTKTYLLKK